LRNWKLISIIICLSILINIKTSDSALEVIPGWYGVEQWEINECVRWGGATEAQSSYSTEGGPVLLSQTTLSLQAKKIVYNIRNATTLYEASWYLEPIGSDMDYTIHLTNPDGNNKLIAEGSAKRSEPVKGYYADYHTTDYKNIKMSYGGKALEVPIIET